MKQKLLIIGAGSVGQFVAYNSNQFVNSYEIVGFLDDDAKKLHTMIAGYEVLGRISDLPNYSGKGIALVLGIAFPQIKRKIIQEYQDYDFEFPNLISKHCWISEGVQFGKGALLYPGTSINYHTKIGDFALINMNCAVGHDVVIGDYVALAPGVNLGGHTQIGNHSEIGIGAATKQFIKIGENAVVGGQAIVVKDVASNQKVKGIPAR